jgi:HK97 family phage major capsid protein
LKDGGQFNNNRNIVQFAVPLHKTRLLEHVIQRKTLVSSASAIGGAMIVNDRLPGVMELYQRERTLLDIVPRAQTDSDMIEYVKIASFTNNAAVVAEASATTGTSGLKPESALATSVVTVAVPTIAHWVPVTNKMLADAPAIRSIIDQHLLVGLELAMEDEVLAGDGTGERMTGILSSGIQTQGKGSDSALDAVFKAMQLVRINGLVRPTAVVMHPTDFGNIRLARENSASATYGGYLMGPPSVAGEVTLWGLPVIQSLALTAGTALVGAFNLGGMLFEREGAQIRVGLINDQFVRNMQTILAEARATWATFRPTAFARVTGI